MVDAFFYDFEADTGGRIKGFLELPGWENMIVAQLRKAIWKESMATFQDFEGIKGHEHLLLWNKRDGKALELPTKLTDVFKDEGSGKAVFVTPRTAERWDGAFVGRGTPVGSTAAARLEEGVAELRKQLNFADSLSNQEKSFQEKLGKLEEEVGTSVSTKESTTQAYEMTGKKAVKEVKTARNVSQICGTTVADLQSVTNVVLEELKARWDALQKGKPVEVSGEENAGKKHKTNAGGTAISELQVQEKMFRFCKVVEELVPSVCWTAHDTSNTPIPGFSVKPDISLCESKTLASMPQLVTVLEAKREIWTDPQYHVGIGQLIERSQLIFK